MKTRAGKLVCILTCIVMCVSLVWSAFGMEKEIVNRKLMEEVGQLFVNSQSQEISNSEHFSKGAKIVLNEVFYDLQGIPSAYNYSVVSPQNLYEGYVIVGAQKKYAPIIEYGFCNKKYSISERALNFAPEFVANKIYYFGGIEYIVEASNKAGEHIYLDPTNERQIVNVQKKQLENFLTNEDVLNQKKIQVDFEEEWNTIKRASKDRTNEILYRNDYTIPNANHMAINYSLMSEFHGYIDHCGPTAAVNYFKCYKYAKSMNITDDWQALFRRIHSDSGCAAGVGTYDTSLLEAINSTWTREGYSPNAILVRNSYNVWQSNLLGRDIAGKLRENKGLVVLFNGNTIYGDHFVFSYGYSLFEFNNMQRYYIKFADGHTDVVRYAMVYSDLVSYIY